MKVKFLRDFRGSPDGQRIINYKKDKVYDTDTGDITESLIGVFKGLGNILEDHIPFERKEPEVVQKAVSEAPQNKAVEPEIIKEEVKEEVKTPEPKKSNKKIRNRK